jgi:protein O-mannosyl-transferase
MTQFQQKKKSAGPLQRQKTKQIPVKKEFRYKNLLPLTVILPLVFMAFYPILGNGFTNWDDPDLILDNPLIRSLDFEHIRKIFTTFYFGNYQPLHLFSYAIEYHFWGLNPLGYHAVSLFLFLITTSLVYYFIFQISNKNLTVAIIAVLLFGINAMRVESVAWAAERKDMLYALFYVAGLIAYVTYIQKLKETSGGLKIRYLVYTFLFFILSVFSKVMAVSMVGALVMIDFYYARRISVRMVLEKLPFVAVSIFLGLTQINATASTGTIDISNQFSFYDRMLIVSRNLMFYVYKMLAPVNLSAFYPYPPKAPGIPWPAEFYIAPVFLIIMLALLLWSMRKTRLFVFCAGFFVSALALVLQYIAIGPALFNERYSLIPAIALSFALAFGIDSLASRYPAAKNILFGATGLYLLAMFYLTFARCSVWQTSLTLWDDVLKQFPDAPLPLNNRGKYYGSELGNTAMAMVDLTASIRANPKYDLAYNNRGIVYSMTGKFDSAIEDFSQAIRLNGSYYEAIVNRAITYAQTNKHDLAIPDFTRSMELDPAKASIYYLDRGICYIRLNQPEKALEDYNLGLAFHPERMELYLQRSQAYYLLGKFTEAYRDVKLARDSGVRVEDAYFNQLRQAAGK